MSANLLINDISIQQAQKLTAILKDHATLKSLCGNKGDETELDMSGKYIGAEGAIMLAPEIVANGALAKLIFGGYGSVLDKSQDTFVPAQPAVLEVGMTEANLSNKHLGVGDTIITAAWISHKDNGAMTKMDVSENRLGAEGSKAISEALKGNQTMNELNISETYPLWDGKEHQDMSGVIAISNAIPTMGALATLDISDNILCGFFRDGSGTYNGAGIEALSEALKGNTSLKSLSMSKTYIGAKGAKVLADGLSANGALTSLNIGSNHLGVYYRDGKWRSDMTGIKALAAAIHLCK